MTCFTKTQQRNGTNCGFEKYATTSNFFVLNSLAKSHLNSVCTEYVCDKSENTRVCAKWQWNALDWCYWIASPVVQSSNTVLCVSLSFRSHLCVLAILSICYKQNLLPQPLPCIPKTLVPIVSLEFSPTYLYFRARMPLAVLYQLTSYWKARRISIQGNYGNKTVVSRQ